MNEILHPNEILFATSPNVIPSLQLSRYHNFLCGTISGCLARTITSPLDVIKLFIQVGMEQHSMWSYAKQIYRRDGFAGFWNGNIISVANQGLYSGIKFLVVREIANLSSNPSHYTNFQAAMTGGIAGVISQAAVFPMDLIRTRIILHPDKYHGFFQTAHMIMKEEGISALWSGITPTVIGSIPYEGSQYLVYGQLRQIIVERTKKPLTPLQNMLLGTCAGMISASMAYPFENIRKFMMTQNAQSHPDYSSMYGCMKYILRTEGIGGLYKGVVLNAFKVIPYSALQYTLYDEVCKLFIKTKKIVEDVVEH